MRGLHLLLLILLLVARSPVAEAQSGDRADAELLDLLVQTNHKVEQFQFSPDGRRIVYLSSRLGDHHLWVMDADGANARAVNPHHQVHQTRDGPSVQPRWSPDGRWISYLSGGDIYVAAADGSLPPANLTYGNGGTTPRWTPDGDHLVYVRNDAGGHAQIVTIPSTIPRDRIDITWLTSGNHSAFDPQISPDGRWIAFTSDRSGKDDRKRNDIWLMPTAGGRPRLLTTGSAEDLDDTPRWSPDSKRIAFVSNRSGWRNIGVIDVERGATTMLTQSAWDEYNPQWSPDGRRIAYVANRDWNFHLMIVPSAGGRPWPLTERDGVSGGIESNQARGTFRWAPDGRTIAFTYMSPTACSDIWTMPVDGGTQKPLTRCMPDGLSETQLVVPERISYTSGDGLEVPAFLYTPRRLPAARRPPLLIYARANVHGMHVNGFYPVIQHLVSRGYVVLAAQVRGSQGLGREYEWKNFGDWGGGDIDDFVAGAEHLADEGLIDPDRIVMQGGSTGGFFTMAMLHRYPDLLKAAVNYYGPTNLVDMYNMWPPSSRPILGDVVGGDHGNPQQAPEHWRSRSAHFNMDTIKTPLLILWGDRDFGVRISMADQYVREARRRGLPTDFHTYDDEPHGWYHWRPATLKDSILRVAAHYEKYVGQ